MSGSQSMEMEWRKHACDWTPQAVAEWKRAYAADEPVPLPHAEHGEGECDHCDRLRSWMVEVDGHPSSEPQTPRKAFWARDAFEWFTAYVEAGFDEDAALRIVVATMGRSTYQAATSPETSELVSRLTALLNRGLDE